MRDTGWDGGWHFELMNIFRDAGWVFKGMGWGRREHYFFRGFCWVLWNFMLRIWNNGEKGVSLRVVKRVFIHLLFNMRRVKMLIVMMMAVAMLPVAALCQTVVSSLDISFTSTSEGSFTMQHLAGIDAEVLYLEERGGQETFTLDSFNVVTLKAMSEVELTCVFIDEDLQHTVKHTTLEAESSGDKQHWSHNVAVDLLSGLQSGKCYTLSYQVQATDSHGTKYKLDNNGVGYGISFVVAGAHYISNGDVNKDGQINTGDVSELYNVILGIDLSNADVADVNGDGVVNTGDVSDLYMIILGQ